MPKTYTESSRIANTSLGSHLKQAKKSDPRETYRLAIAFILAPLIRKKKHIVFERPYASAAGASEESFSIFCDVFLKMLYIKTYQANILVLSLHVGKYREKRIFCLFKTQMILVNKNPLHVLVISREAKFLFVDYRCDRCCAFPPQIHIGCNPTRVLYSRATCCGTAVLPARCIKSVCTCVHAQVYGPLTIFASSPRI